MKNLTTIIIFLSVIIFTRCSGISKPKDNYSKKVDTMRTLALYKLDKTLNYDLIYRLSWDSLMFVPVNENTQKKIWKKYRVYVIPFNEISRDSTGKELKDSLGRRIINTKWLYLDAKNVIIDGDKNIDSILNEFSKQNLDTSKIK